MPHYAVSSYFPGAPGQDWSWPESGTADRAQVIGAKTEVEFFTVLSVPVQQPAHLHWHPDAHWVVLDIHDYLYKEENGFVEFEKGEVIFNGSPKDACAFLKSKGLEVPRSKIVKVAPDWEDVETDRLGMAVAGTEGNATSGDYGIAYGAVAVTGQWGISIGGMAEAGDWGIATGSEAIAGNNGVAIMSGEFSKVKAGDGGVAISDNGETTVGERGIAISYEQGVFEGGLGSLFIAWYNDEQRYEVATVGENGIEPNKKYKFDWESGEFVEDR